MKKLHSMESKKAMKKMAKAIKLIEQAAAVESNSIVLLRLSTAEDWARKALHNY